MITRLRLFFLRRRLDQANHLVEKLNDEIEELSLILPVYERSRKRLKAELLLLEHSEYLLKEEIK